MTYNRIQAEQDREEDAAVALADYADAAAAAKVTKIALAKAQAKHDRAVAKLRHKGDNYYAVIEGNA